MEARKRFAYGISVDHIENSVDPNVIAFIRTGKSSQEPGCVVVMSNKPQRTNALALYIGKQRAGTKWCNFLGRGSRVSINEDGVGKFPIHFGACVYVRESDCSDVKNQAWNQLK